MSSLENISSEAIQCLAFADSYTKKSDPSTFPTLWVGTSLGSILTIMINLPPPGETRLTQPVVVSPWGKHNKDCMRHCVILLMFICQNSFLLTSTICRYDFPVERLRFNHVFLGLQWRFNSLFVRAVER